jgi:hypothetical protein
VKYPLALIVFGEEQFRPPANELEYKPAERSLKAQENVEKENVKEKPIGQTPSNSSLTLQPEEDEQDDLKRE